MKTELKVFTSNEVGINDDYQINLVILDNYKIDEVKVLFNREWEKPSIIETMDKVLEKEGKTVFSTIVRFSNFGNYYFFFSIKIDGQYKAIKIDRITNEPIIVDESFESLYWKVLVTQEKWTVPEWSTDCIYYQLRVDRFKKGNNINYGKNPLRNYLEWGEVPLWKRNEFNEFHNNCYYGGNLDGIKSELNYFLSLGIKTIYISPIFESESFDYKYDNRVDGYAATDFLKIDSDKGTYDDLVSLYKETRKKGMRLILDIALNHCSVNNPIFLIALNNPKSEYRDWFYWDEEGNYRYWYDFKDMPVFNLNSIGYRNYVKKMVNMWAEVVDGVRFDLGENLDQDFLREVRKETDKHGKHLYIGECWDLKDTNTFGKRGLDCPTNYPFADGIYKFVLNKDGDYLSDNVRLVLDSYPQVVIDTMLNSLDTHDTIRALTILSGKPVRNDIGYKVWEIDREPTIWHKDGKFDTDSFRQFEFDNDKLSDEEMSLAIKRLKVCAILQYFLPGNPCLYYGTEVGLTGYKDPFSRKCFPWDNINEELLNYFRSIGEFRNKYTGKESKFKELTHSNGLYSFIRNNGKDKLFVIVNVGDDCYFDIPDEFNDDLNDKFIVNCDIKQNRILNCGGLVILKHLL